ncbi:hypothetical protein [Marisediminicola senii]|uniref:hypothetical protein n=1 Tax=Marisediminicola senii TaxID=2711233 RepID=UPI0013EB0DC4|nr:hypothetical protein [Marisediminicola senii]
MHSRGARLARGFAAASLATLVAAVFHAAGGGGFPHVALLAVGLVFCTLFCVALAGRTVSWLRLTASVSVSQLAFHLIFGTAGGPGLDGTGLEGAVFENAVLGGAGHAQHGGAFTIADGAVAATSGGAGHGMLLAHVIAAAITIVGIRFGETAFWALVDTAVVPLAAAFRWMLPAPLEQAPRPTVAVASRGFEPRLRTDLLSVARYRGPPVVRLS